MSLSGSRRATLGALVARLIPGDAASPGALEAGVPEFVEAQLAGSFAPALDAVGQGLDGLDQAAGAAGGRSFGELSPEQQDSLLGAREAAPFFELLLQLAIDGFLCDPRHGGDRDLVRGRGGGGVWGRRCGWGRRGSGG